MGTRCLTFVYNESYDPVVCIYRQFDGYPGGHGKELAEFLKDRKVIYGIPPEKQMQKASNGMECLAASLISELKTEIGNIYLFPTNSKDCNQDYEYRIYPDRIEVKNYSGSVLHSGDWNSFKQFCEEDDE